MNFVGAGVITLCPRCTAEAEKCSEVLPVKEVMTCFKREKRKWMQMQKHPHFRGDTRNRLVVLGIRTMCANVSLPFSVQINTLGIKQVLPGTT